MDPTPAPRIWPALTLAVAAPLAANLLIVVLIAGAVGAMLAWDPSTMDELLADLQAGKFPNWALAFGMFVGTLPFGVLPAIAALRSPVPFRERLGLVHARIRPSSLAVATVVGIALSQVWSFALSFVLPDETFAYMQPLVDAIRNAPLPAALAIGLAMSVTPGVCEELLFRGYVQRRLLARWSPPVAIGVTSVLFSMAHLHPAHMLATLVISIWLGLLAWRTGSVWPSMVVHGVNNAFAVGMLMWAPESWTELGVTVFAVPIAILGAAALFGLEWRQSGRGSGSVPYHAR